MRSPLDTCCFFHSMCCQQYRSCVYCL